ncbi:hypothetical protein BH11VER1_BH11VER1_03740 [soil metagenome]
MITLRTLCLTSALAGFSLLTTQAEDWKPELPPAPVLDISKFAVPEGLEVTLWAKSPLFYNPTNMDVDQAGRLWVAEGVNYRKHEGRRPEGDRIVVLEDKDGDGVAESSHTFVQEKFLVAPLGVAVFDNVVVVSQPPDMIVYTDVNRNQVFDPGVDKREVLLTGFNGRNHDHSLHSVTGGPDGLWYFNQGNTCAQFKDKDGYEFRIGSPYKGANGKFATDVSDPATYAGKASDDGHVYVGGFTVRMNPDGSKVEVIGHNYRNSYEQTITSFGDVFQNDNDDPPACRTSFILEYGNAGFASADGKRTWAADKRPGQDVPTAEWRQDDPGTMPVGDVYGGGAPTGIVFYENGALGDKFNGLLLSCESGRNVVFGYHPKLEGAGYKLDRFNFFTSNKEGEFVGSDFVNGGKGADPTKLDTKTIFRPSDVCVGADGAIYVADWFDPRTGGHQDLDDSCTGAIYRIAPKGFKPVNPKIDLKTIEGQIAALKSPAKNVRWLGFTALKAAGAPALPALKEVQGDGNPWVAARAIWLLPRLGEEGVKATEALLNSEDENIRITAFRSLRRVNQNVVAHATTLANDASAAVRREAAVAMRDVPYAQSKPVLLAIAKTLDASDRTLLDALGIGAMGKEVELYQDIAALAPKNAEEWSPSLARIAWRLMTPGTVPLQKARAMNASLAADQRELAVDALAFIKAPEAPEALFAVVSSLPEKDTLRDKAIWWLTHRSDDAWADYGVDEKLTAQGLSAPPPKLMAMITPDVDPTAANFDAKAILAMQGDVARGKLVATRCVMCHKVGGQGVDHGPGLTGWGKTQPREVILEALLLPSKTIAHGYEGTQIITKDGTIIDGIVVSEGKALSIRSTGGMVQKVPVKDIAQRKPMTRSLMMSAGQLGFKAEEIADLMAYLQAGGE